MGREPRDLASEAELTMQLSLLYHIYNYLLLLTYNSTADTFLSLLWEESIFSLFKHALSLSPTSPLSSARCCFVAL